MVTTQRQRRARLDFEAMERLSRLADYTIPFVICAVCRLGVADHLGETPRSLEELAQICQVDAPSLLRAMRALTKCGLFVEPTHGQFALTDIGRLLRSDHPLSMGAALAEGGDVEALAMLTQRVKMGQASGAAPLTAPLRQSVWTGVVARARVEAELALRCVDWSVIQRVTELGGEDDTFLIQLLAGAPHLLAMRVDIPQEPNETSIPAESDSFVMRRVLSALDDARTRSLLDAVGKALSEWGRLLIFEPLESQGHLGAAADLRMLALGAGRVRTQEELASLLAASGLKINRLVNQQLIAVLEVVAA